MFNYFLLIIQSSNLRLSNEIELLKLLVLRMPYIIMDEILLFCIFLFARIGKRNE